MGGYLQSVGGAAHTPVNLITRRFRLFQPKGHILKNRHMRVERIGLENHGNAALGRNDVIDNFITYCQIAAGDILQAGNHSQQC